MNKQQFTMHISETDTSQTSLHIIEQINSLNNQGYIQLQELIDPTLVKIDPFFYPKDQIDLLPFDIQDQYVEVEYPVVLTKQDKYKGYTSTTCCRFWKYFGDATHHSLLM